MTEKYEFRARGRGGKIETAARVTWDGTILSADPEEYLEYLADGRNRRFDLSVADEVPKALAAAIERYSGSYFWFQPVSNAGSTQPEETEEWCDPPHPTQRLMEAVAVIYPDLVVGVPPADGKLHPSGEPLPPPTDEDTIPSVTDVIRAVQQWDGEMPDWAVGLLTARGLPVGPGVSEYGVKGKSGHFGHRGRPGKVGGSARSKPAGAYVAVGRNAEVACRMAVGALLSWGKKNNKEGAIGVRADGTQVDGFIEGRSSAVPIEEALGGPTTILLHNHPESFSFSAGDMWVMMRYPEIEHMIVIAHDGTLYRVSKTDETDGAVQGMGGPEKNWSRWAANEIEWRWNKLDAQLYRKYNDLVRFSGLPPHREQYERSHGVMEALAEEWGLDYVRVRPPKQ